MDSMVWLQWVSVVELPVILFLMSEWLKSKRDMDRALSAIRESISAFKLEVAGEYASRGDLRETEGRLIKSIDKLDSTIESLGEKISNIGSITHR